MIFNALPLNKGIGLGRYEIESVFIYHYPSIYYQKQLDNHLAHAKQFFDHILHSLIPISYLDK